ncbi:hypothetical protein [Streptomyces sp. NPDC059071]|uniref:hypothetical protein n=1 Tax=unclassified Streptomyces TaxID=2593676 RepID=UPI00366709AB
MSAISDFNPSARADARRDPRYAVVLEQVRKMAWPAGNPMVPGGWAETLAKDVMTAVRRQEGQHRKITHQTYEGPGPCQATFYGAGACGYPREEHALLDDEPEPAAAEDSGPATAGSVDGGLAYVVPSDIADPTVVIHGVGGRSLVTFHLGTGEMEFGPGYTPDAAAEAFWDAVDAHAPAPVRQDHAARAAVDRAWKLVAQWRQEAADRGEDPYAGPRAQALAAALVGDNSSGPAVAAGA